MRLHTSQNVYINTNETKFGGKQYVLFAEYVEFVTTHRILSIPSVIII